MQQGRDVKRMMKQKNLSPEDAVIRQIWRKATENQTPAQHWKTVNDRITLLLVQTESNFSQVDTTDHQSQPSLDNIVTKYL